MNIVSYVNKIYILVNNVNLAEMASVYVLCTLCIQNALSDRVPNKHLFFNVLRKT